MRAEAGRNNAAAVSCGVNKNWIYGNMLLDRDRYNQDRDFGISIAGGRIIFGVQGALGDTLTICGTTAVTDGLWHHIAAQRRRSDGQMSLYVDGVLQARANGPDGDVSYPDNGTPGNFCNGACVNSDPFVVLAAEKHDAGSQYPSFAGWMDELRISTALRYSADFAPPAAPFTADAATAALYHFDEGAGAALSDTSGAAGGPSTGVVRFSSDGIRPQWVASDAPLSTGVGDTAPPVVSISAPAPSSSHSGLVAVDAAATDQGGTVVGVQFRLDGQDLGAEDTVSPYSTTWDTRTTANGPRTISAVARDSAGNIGYSTAVSVTVNNPTTLPGTPVAVTFDNPTPAGNSEALIEGVFQGLDFGTGLWRWERAYGPNATNHIYFDSNSGTSRVIRFAGGPAVFRSIRVFATAPGSLTISDDRGQSHSVALSPGSLVPVITGWTQASSTLTVFFSAGWSLGVDDIEYVTAGGTPTGSDTTPPAIAFTSPQAGAPVSGAVPIGVTATDNVGVAGVQFRLDGVNLGAEHTTGQAATNWDTTGVSNGFHTLTAIARDDAGNRATATLVVTVSNNTTPPPPVLSGAPLRQGQPYAEAAVCARLGVIFCEDFDYPQNSPAVRSEITTSGGRILA